MSSKVDGNNASEASNDWWLSDEDQGWVDILMDLEEGRQPDKQLLAKLLRTSRYDVDQRVREYLADHLEGKTRKPRGRPPATDTTERIRRDFVVRLTYWKTLADLRKIPKFKRNKSTPSEIALEETVRVLATEKNIHTSAGTVRKIVYPKGTKRKPR